VQVKKMQKILWGFLSLVSLTVCLFSAVGYFLGKVEASQYKLIFLVSSFGWFIFATLWARQRKN